MVVMMMAVVVVPVVVMVVVMAMSVRHGRGAQCESRTGGHDKRSTTQRFGQVEHAVHS
ncbi:MAG TPA: hypothetical protein VN524_09965 [Hyphomicrobiaceae bacterium]|jgi:heme/copper-type cytochrome/quinol oxidase subunit 2|nr:hypothetical protein [Hyphomicrobiaceae bacterium]